MTQESSEMYVGGFKDQSRAGESQGGFMRQPHSGQYNCDIPPNWPFNQLDHSDWST